MSPRRLLGPALALFLGTGGALAQAGGPATWTLGEEVTATPEVVAGVAAAQAHWGTTVDCLRVVVAADNLLYAAVSYRPCTTELNLTWLARPPTPSRFCTVIVHEYGHLIGYSHAYGAIDPVMRAVDPPAPPECPQPPRHRKPHRHGR